MKIDLTKTENFPINWKEDFNRGFVMKIDINKEIAELKNTLTCIPFSSVRVMKPVAAELLKRNDTLIWNGTVRHFQIKNLGLGVCEVALQKTSGNIGVTTEMVKKIII